MSLQVEIVDPRSYEGWDNLVLSLNDYSFFHSAAWARVLCDTYGYTPRYFLFKYGDRVKGLIPVMDIKSILTGRRGVSLPFSDFCNPMLDGCAPSQNMFEQMISYGKKFGWKRVEFRGAERLLTGVRPHISYLCHTLSLLPDEEKIFLTLKDNTRRNIKKAMREKGLEVRILESHDSIREFYRLNCMTRKQHGLPPQPYSFFEKVYNHVISKNLGFIVVAYFQKKAIAANMYFHFRDKAIFKYGASDRIYQSLRAGNLVMWEAIKRCKENGYHELHFGRTESQNQGLRKFKIGWGTKEYTINYFKYDLVKNSFLKEDSNPLELFNKIFKKTPVPILQAVGASLYRHMA